MQVNKKADAPVQPIQVRVFLLEFAEAQLRTMGERLRGTVVFQSVNSREHSGTSSEHMREKIGVPYKPKRRLSNDLWF